MQTIITIMRRELRSYFDSPVAYIVIVTFLLIAGWMFFSPFFLMGRADMRVFFSPSPFSPSMLLVILAPAMSMRLIAEERKTGTIEMLTTMPITDGQIIVGKFLASLGILAVALGATLLFPLTISFLGPLDWGPVVSGYVGMLLFASTLLAIGLFFSTVSDNQIVAFIISFIVCAGLYFIFWLQFFFPGAIGDVIEFISLSSHLDNLARGVIDTRDVLYYLTFTGGALFLAVNALERQHA